MQSPPAISINNLYKDYQGTIAVNNISFDIHPGEFFGFLGPNGAGKTTTINLITGLANPTSGTISIFGHDVVQDYRKARACIGLAPQEFNFDPFFCIKDLLMYQAGYYGIPRKEAQQRVDQILHQFGLHDKRNLPIKKLSGGMKRRLQIVKALIHRPRILILDEPTAGVDVELRRKLWDDLIAINKAGTTILLTTHYIEEAEKLCSRIAVINHGKIIAQDKTKSLIKAVSADMIEVRLKHSLQKVPRELQKCPFQLLDDGKLFLVSSNDPEKELPGLLLLFTKYYIPIESVRIQKNTLEEVFLQLTALKKKKYQESPKEK